MTDEELDAACSQIKKDLRELQEKTGSRFFLPEWEIDAIIRRIIVPLVYAAERRAALKAKE